MQHKQNNIQTHTHTHTHTHTCVFTTQKKDSRWNLSFQDTVAFNAENEFHDKLLSLLRKAPQVVSLSFTVSSPFDEPPPDMKMGYLGAHLPPSVRFVNFSGVLSSESIQTLCVKLKKMNPAFQLQTKRTETGGGDLRERDIAHSWFLEASGKEGGKLPETFYGYHPLPPKGLLGLGLTDVSFVPADIDALCELLTPPLSRLMGSTLSQHTHSHSQAFSANDLIPLPGLRQLDVSNCQMSDAVVAQIIKAFANGPLENVDFSGNLHDAHRKSRGHLFLEALSMHVACNPHSHLRHLGLSRCKLSSFLFVEILLAFQENNTLTSLDLSYNDLPNSTSNMQALRQFLKKNKALRQLDLCYNSFNAASSKEIFLGLLHNDTLLLLPLVGNTGILMTNEMHLIQEHLNDNRRRYKKQVDAYNSMFKDGGDVEESTSPEGSDSLSEAVPVAVAVPVLSEDDGERIMSGANKGVGATPLPSASPVSVEKSPITSSTPATPTSTSNFSSATHNTLTVLFSSPLAWRDKQNRLHPLTMLNYRGERDQILQVFQEVHNDVSVCFDFATTNAMRTSLSFGCRALHFSGHGHPKYLNFEDGRSGLQLVSVAQLKSLLRAGGLTLEFVCVSACHSRATGEAFVEAGVKHVVCVKVDEAIQDSAAMAFTRAFYIPLLSGKTVQQAFEIASEAIKTSPYVSSSFLEGEKFVLLPEGGNHDEAIFNAAPLTEWPLRPSHCIMGQQGVTIGIGGSGKEGGVRSGTSLSSERDDSDSQSWREGDADVDTPQPQAQAEVVRSHIGLSLAAHLPSPPPDFEGRETDMHKIITTLTTRRLVTVIGDLGMGKSSVACAVAVYTAERRIFADGVLHVRVQSCRSHFHLLTALLHSISSGGGALVSKMKARFESLTKSQGKVQHMLTGAVGGGVEDTPSTLSLHALEELVVSCLGSLNVLIVLDHIDTLLSEDGEADDFKVFLGHLFESCAYIKLLIASSETLAAQGISGFGVVENAIALGPLSLLSSLLLFTHLSPSLASFSDKNRFIEALLPPKQHHVTLHSKDVTVEASKILELLGGGHPAHIVKLACECGVDGVQELLQKGKVILNGNGNGNGNGDANGEAVADVEAITTGKVGGKEEGKDAGKEKEKDYETMGRKEGGLVGKDALPVARVEGREVLRPSPYTSFSPIPDGLGMTLNGIIGGGGIINVAGGGDGLSGGAFVGGASSAFTRQSFRDKERDKDKDKDKDRDIEKDNYDA